MLNTPPPPIDHGTSVLGLLLTAAMIAVSVYAALGAVMVAFLWTRVPAMVTSVIVVRVLLTWPAMAFRGARFRANATEQQLRDMEVVATAFRRAQLRDMEAVATAVRRARAQRGAR